MYLPELVGLTYQSKITVVDVVPTCAHVTKLKIFSWHSLGFLLLLKFSSQKKQPLFVNTLITRMRIHYKNCAQYR